MKPLLLAAFVLIATSIIAQKRYDCIIKTINSNPNENRLVGTLKQINDTSMVLLMRNTKDTVLHWTDLRAVKFKTHNGFMRTVLPIALLTSVSVTTIVYCTAAPNAGLGRDFYTALGFSLGFGDALFIGTPTYFILRNQNFHINNYEDFQSLKLASNKYLIK